MTARLSLLFFGTSEFAVPILAGLAHGEHEVRAVYTQPDRAAGRGRKLRPSPVAAVARELALRLEQPEEVRSAAVIEGLSAYEPDAVVLAAYGRIIPRAALEAPSLGWLNVHPSLLPRYRGASPVAAPILAGDRETGVSIFLMGAGLDDGPVLAQERTPIGPDETTGELTLRLAQLGAGMLPDTLQAWAGGSLQAQEQDGSVATYAKKLTREESVIRWSEPAELIARRVRAYNPWPVAHTYWGTQRLRVLRAESVDAILEGAPGAVYVESPIRYPAVRCGRGSLVLREVQLPGGRPLDGRSLLTGRRELDGAVLLDHPDLAPNSDS